MVINHRVTREVPLWDGAVTACCVSVKLFSELKMSVAEINRFVVRVGHGVAIGVFVLTRILTVALGTYWMMN